VIGTAFFAYCAGRMADMSRVLAKHDEARRYDQLFADARNAWRRRFVAPDGSITVNTQTAHVLALHFDLLEEKHRPAAVDALVRDIESRGLHLSTGFVGTPYLNPVLTRFGRADLAYALLQQKSFPSWLYPVTQGATTMWERWDAWTHDKGFSDTGMNSFNHYAFGAVGEWLYATVAGIDIDPGKPGYRHVVVRPRPGGELTWAKGSLRTMYGSVESASRIDGARFALDVTIPANATGTVHLPDGTQRGVGAGRHRFDCPM
jgi:alpha-L-rhamnosidase